MWVDSKSAASLLHIKYDALQKAINRAQKKDKKFCFTKCNILHFRIVTQAQRGRGGKVLQIWLDDELVIDAIKRGAIVDPALKAKLLSALNMQGISCNDTPISDNNLRDIKESRVKNEYNDTKSNSNSDGGCCNGALDRDFKSYSDMDNTPNVNNFKNGTHCRLKDIKNSSDCTKFQGE